VLHCVEDSVTSKEEVLESTREGENQLLCLVVLHEAAAYWWQEKRFVMNVAM
jgi:hypothetical protein